MKTAIQRFGYTCVAALVAAGITGSMFAQTTNLLTVNLPEDVTVGATLLPAGNYTVEDLQPISGNHLFLFRGENNKPVILQAATIGETQENAKTAVVLTRTGSAAHLDKIVVQGSSIGYEFAGATPVRN